MLDVNLVTNLYTCWGATQSARQCWRLKLKSYILVLLSFRSRYNWYPGQSNTAPTSKQILQHKESLHFKDMKNLCVKQQPKRLAYSTVHCTMIHISDIFTFFCECAGRGMPHETLRGLLLFHCLQQHIKGYFPHSSTPRLLGVNLLEGWRGGGGGLKNRVEWFSTFWQFSKMDTLLASRYSFMISIPKKSANFATRSLAFSF